MSRICKRFADGKRPYSLEELSKVTSIPVRIANDMLFNLIDCNMLIEISSDEKGETSRFVPSESINNLNLGVMVDRLEASGKWKMSLSVNQLLNEKWKKALELRAGYLKSMRDIRLENLVPLKFDKEE
jgi:membrane protein